MCGVAGFSPTVGSLIMDTSTGTATTRTAMAASTKEAGATGYAQVLVSLSGRTASGTMGHGQSTNATAVASTSGPTGAALKEIT